MMSQLTEIKKPTVGFSARFFFELSRIRKWLPGNDLQTNKTTKNVKKCKIKCFFSAPNPSFSCQNDPKKALFCCQYVF
jgi:hypothetical protein